MSLDNSNVNIGEEPVTKYDRSSPSPHKIFSIQDVPNAEQDTGLKFGEVFSSRAQKDRDLWNKIATSLVPGQVYSSYTDLCRAIGLEPARGGRNRLLQESKLKRFIDYSISNTGALTINKLTYDATDASGKFVTDLQNILILVALRGQEVTQFDPECVSCYEISRNQLHLMLGMRNPYFQTLIESLRGQKGFAEEFTDKEIQQLAELCYIVNHRTNQVVGTTLDSMQNRGMISCTERIRYTYREHYQTQTDLSNNYQRFLVQQIEDTVLREQFHLEPDQKYKLFFTEENGVYVPGQSSRWTEYRWACQQAVTEQLNWINYEWVYQIFFYPSEELLAFSEKFSNKSKEELEEILETSLVRVNENLIKSLCKEDTHAFGRYSEDELERLKFTKLIVSIEDFMQKNNLTLKDYVTKVTNFAPRS